MQRHHDDERTDANGRSGNTESRTVGSDAAV